MIYYIGYYGGVGTRVKRIYELAGTHKMNYIIHSLLHLGKKVNVISMSVCAENKFKIYKGEYSSLADNCSLYYFPTFGGNNLIFSKLRILWMRVQLVFFLLFHVNSDDIILAYHSLGYKKIIAWVRKIKKFKLILEVEEIYSDSSLLKEYQKKEEQYLLKEADSYIFASSYLEKSVNPKKNKPSVVVNGNYEVEEKITERFNDNKIHVVYSGTFNAKKGGAYGAIHSAEFLDERYCLHILGFGTNTECSEIKKAIEETQKKSKAEIRYVGCLPQSDYIEYIQRCHIGLSTQNVSDSALGDSCFPSKILTYLANGLSVVSGSIPVIRESVVGEYLFYYSEQDPSSIAQTIMQVDVNRDSRSVLRKLDMDFKNKLGTLLSSFE